MNGAINVTGEEMPMLQIVAILESLQAERPLLFSCLKSFHSSSEEMNILYRALIREDYENFAADEKKKINEIILSEPSCTRINECADSLLSGSLVESNTPSTVSSNTLEATLKEEERIAHIEEEERIANIEAMQFIENMISNNGWKRCPSCQNVIERLEGSDDIKCNKCKCWFCYVCGKYDATTPTKRGDCGSRCRTKKF